MAKTITAEQQASMESTWLDYCREANIAQDEIPQEHDGWFGWLHFAKMHYHEPMPQSASDWAATVNE
jgi:hypothetical protein